MNASQKDKETLPEGFNQVFGFFKPRTCFCVDDFQYNIFTREMTNLLGQIQFIYIYIYIIVNQDFIRTSFPPASLVDEET